MTILRFDPFQDFDAAGSESGEHTWERRTARLCASCGLGFHGLGHASRHR